MNKKRTYCPFYEICENGAFCPDKLTLKVREFIAYAGIELSFYGEPPERCYRKLER